MISLGERIASEREAKGWSQARLAEELRRRYGLKTKQSTIHSIEIGYSKKPTILVDLANLFGVRPEWLKTGRGERAAKPVSNIVHFRVFGYVGARERVDVGALQDDGEEIQVLDDGYSAVVVRGNSMLPAYRDGDYVFFRQVAFAVEGLINRDCIVITDRDRAYIKRVKRGRSPGLFDLLSYNPEIDPIVDVALKQAWPVEWIRRA